MANIVMKIHDIKGINNGTIELPIENGLYAIVGNNGTGKSTIMSCLAQLISKHNLGMLRKEDYSVDSYVEFIYNGRRDKWRCNQNGFWKSSAHPNEIRFNGTYEGSLFYGQRFNDSKNVDELMSQGKIHEESIVDADQYIVDSLGKILHNDVTYYNKLLKIKNKNIAQRLNLNNTPYFYTANGKIISQYRMSSGECLLISLLHFIYNSIIRRSLPTDQPILMLIDEIELALHPIAISNLLDLLIELTDKYDNLSIIITSHSPEVIRKIQPKNIYKLERVNAEENNFDIINPCYPSYAIRDIYRHDGFDYLILVEDELAKLIVLNSIDENHLGTSRLLSVVPVGGWQNVLKLQMELIVNNILGVGKNVFCVLDGDVENKITKDYKSLKKLFLPISSVEKFLLDILVNNPNTSIKKQINDRFFMIESLDDILHDYILSEKKLQDERGADYKNDNDGKRLYTVIMKSMTKRKVSEEHFIDGLYKIIMSNYDFSKFSNNLKTMLE